MGAALIGGGYALLPLLEREVVTRRKWARSEEMIDLYALAQVLPGVIAVNTAMLIGNRLRGLAGTLTAAFGLTLPPFLMIAAYAATYGTLRDTAIFSRALSGVQPAVAGMILGLGVDMVRKLGPRDKGQGPRDKGQGPRDEGQGSRAKGQGSRAKGQGPRDERQGTRDKGQGMRDKAKNVPLMLALAAAVAMLLFNPSFGWLILFSIVAGVVYHAYKIRRAAKC